MKLSMFNGLLTKEDVMAKYKELAKVMHPDSGGSTESFVLLNTTKDHVIKSIADGTWAGGKTKAGSWLFEALITRMNDGVIEHYTKQGVIYHYPNPKDVQKIVRILRGFDAVSDSTLRQKVMYSFPEKHKSNTDAVWIQREPHEVPLSDLIEEFKNGIDHKYASWVVSSMLNACCYMASQKLVHGGLTPKNILVNIDKHSIRIVGGWQFHTVLNSQIDKVPGWVYNHIPKSCFADKKSNYRIDQESFKAMIRSATTATLDMPKPFRRWLDIPCGDDPVETYGSWVDIRDKIYERKFIKWEPLPKTLELY